MSLGAQQWETAQREVHEEAGCRAHTEINCAGTRMPAHLDRNLPGQPVLKPDSQHKGKMAVENEVGHVCSVGARALLCGLEHLMSLVVSFPSMSVSGRLCDLASHFGLTLSMGFLSFRLLRRQRAEAERTPEGFWSHLLPPSWPILRLTDGWQPSLFFRGRVGQQIHQP